MRFFNKLVLTISFPFVLGIASFAEAPVQKVQQAEVKLRPFSQGAPELVFDHDVSGILGADDEYTLTLSKFDYAAKYQSDKPLTPAERSVAFKGALDKYTPANIEKLRKAFDMVFAKMKGMDVKLPETIYIFSEQKIEAGAAYTRANSICMPKQVVAMSGMDQIRDLAAHEIFHVISRYNTELRTPIYSTLGFKPVGPLVLTGELANRTIANPDAPENTYAITCKLKGKNLQFMPILYSKQDFPKGGGSFFRFLNDDLIAVEIKDGKPVSLEREGKPFIVKKEELDDYFDQIGKNTDYTFHPEETSADHFKQLLFWDVKKLPNPEKVEALEKIFRE
jgi:hypothetical protein